MSYHEITIAGGTRRLPIVPVNDNVSIAAFIIFGDTEIVEPCARELAAKLPPVDYLITAEAKSIPLIYEMAKVLKMPRYIIARKSQKVYMTDSISVDVQSITTKDPQVLYLDGEDAARLKGAKVAIVDDVISTGASLAALEMLVAKAGGTVEARAAILSEGDANARDDLIVLGHLPLFIKNQN